MSLKIQNEDNNAKIERNVVDLCSQTLKKIAEDKNIGNEYLSICACALEINEEFLGKQYDFAVDVEKIAERMGVQVVYQALNQNLEPEETKAHYVVGRTVKIKNRITGGQIQNILIDSESGRSEQRYALAHELAHYLIHCDESNYNSAYCVMPMLFKNMEEMVADIFASFLLIPIPIFLNEFESYIGTQPVPFKTSDWLKYLSIVAEVPYECVAISYEYIRFVCGILYNIREERKNLGYSSDEQQKISTSDIIAKWEEKILNYMTDNTVGKLFY